VIADYIIRNLKKGLVGKALMAIAWLGAGAFGGVYDEDDKKKAGSPDYGEIKVGVHTIPAALLHAPAFTLMQVTATARRVVDAEMRRNAKKGQTTGTGEEAATALDMASQERSIRSLSLRLRKTSGRHSSPAKDE
jgi:hypothetical protein